MAVTKIHPIKSTLKAALDYIMDSNKTDEKILISSLNCNPITAHLEFEQTKIECNSKAKVLARHLIQAFAPGETTSEEAHKIGIELCEKVLQGKYEYVITTHVDKEHIHNHILFNNVSFDTGKAYQSNKKSYHQIRNYSDDLCRKYKLSVIDEDYMKFKNKYKTNGKSYKEYMEFKKGRFIRTKETTLGKDYTNEKIKERIENNMNKKFIKIDFDSSTKAYKKVDNIIDLKNNKKYNLLRLIKYGQRNTI